MTIRRNEIDRKQNELSVLMLSLWLFLMYVKKMSVCTVYILMSEALKRSCNVVTWLCYKHIC